MDKLYDLGGVNYGGDSLLYMAAAGAVSDFDIVVSAMHQEQFFGTYGKHGVAAIIMGVKYVYILEQDKNALICLPKKTKMADGSGGSFARAGMELGLSAIDAVKLAIKLDAGSGGKVQSVSRK